MTLKEIEKEIKRTGECAFMRNGTPCTIQESTTEEEDADKEPIHDVPCYLYDTYETMQP